MLVSDFDFELPEELIAQTPPAVRGGSRMLRVERSSGALADEVFSSLPQHLAPGDLLVMNDARVLPARLYAVRAGHSRQASSPAPSGRIEVLLTGQPRVASEPGTAAAGNVWTALVRPARKVAPGETLRFVDETGVPALTADVLAAGEFGERTLRFAPEADFFAIVERIGHLPLPPYIRREAGAADRPEDRARYQTVYSAGQPGSAAAPTAGLHFTPEMLAALAERGVELARLTLHVGLGTFQPVRVERVDQIQLHTEAYTLPAETAAAINRARRDGRRIVAVGTTTTRTLEHCARAAAGAELQPHSGATDIFLKPGDAFELVGGLLTNFHLPQSTLLMLVSAFLAPASPGSKNGAAGEAETGRRRALAAYTHAVAERYRFFSYGDCMLIL